MTNGHLSTLRIEVDGHFHGSSVVPKPWVARIDGVDPKYGLARTFIDQLRDYAGAKRSCAGRLNGVVACFPLRDGNLYEVSRLRGSSSKRHVVREFLVVEDGKRIGIDSSAALARVDPYDGATMEHIVSDGTAISRVYGLGTPAACGFVLVGASRGERLYRLRVGSIYEVSADASRNLVLVGDHVTPIAQAVAMAHLSSTTPEAA